MDHSTRHNSESEVDANENKQPLKRLQIALHRIVKVSIPLHLELLSKHKENIEKFQNEGQWNLVHSEQVNASRTVQQLKSDIYELETVRQQVKSEELAEFDKRVENSRTKALEAIDSFIEIHSSVVQPFKPLLLDNNDAKPTPIKRSPTPPMVSLPEEFLNQNPIIPEAEEAVETGEQKLQLKVEPPKDSLASRSWNTLKSDLLELNALIRNFALFVTHQQVAINSIEYNVESAHHNVREGTKSLGKAAALKAAMLPVTGAVIGGIVGGPIGLLAGFKLAGVAGLVSGGVLGFTGGKYLQKKKTKVSDVELQNLSSSSIQRSHSSPDLNNEIS
ncbi:syntaxin-17 [Centruroides vittatus]|uniref:syntaxin-17 n=1 Tax=Centruroides vittatus TaxID=120091 RepID=UPI00350F06A2